MVESGCAKIGTKVSESHLAMRGTVVVFATGLVATVSAFQGSPVSAVTSRHAAVSMGANVKELRERVTSVKNTKKITSAMKLVAAAKVRRAQEAVIRSRPFSETLERILGGLLARLSTEALDIPLMETREVPCIDCTAHNAPLPHGLVSAATLRLCTAPRPRRESKPSPTPEPREQPTPKTARSQHHQLTPALAHSQAKNVAIVAVTGDRGLCGGYNAQMIKKTEARILELKDQVPHQSGETAAGRVDCAS